MSDKLTSYELPIQKDPNDSHLSDGWHRVAASNEIKNGEKISRKRYFVSSRIKVLKQ